MNEFCYYNQNQNEEYGHHLTYNKLGPTFSTEDEFRDRIINNMGVIVKSQNSA